MHDYCDQCMVRHWNECRVTHKAKCSAYARGYSSLLALFAPESSLNKMINLPKDQKWIDIADDVIAVRKSCKVCDELFTSQGTQVFFGWRNFLSLKFHTSIQFHRNARK